MNLHNKGLREIKSTLCPEIITKESKNEVKKDEDVPMNDSNGETTNIPTQSASSSTSSEFIPHIFFTLHNITKDPNNSSNQLETSTGFIRHRLKTCKNLLIDDENNDQCLHLLSKTPDEWNQYITSRENELQGKKKILKDLKERLNTLNNQLAN